MASNSDPPGLLTKMVKLMRGEPDSASRSSSANQAPDSEYDKSALQERIERKRQDDIVRRREFNHLRTLRKSSPLFTGGGGARSSTFQNSAGFDRKERALTVKKIDDIEATMSKHWLERKPNETGYAKEQRHSIQAPIRTEAMRRPRVSTLAPKPVEPAAPKSAEPGHSVDLLPFDEYDFTKMAAPVSPAAPLAPAYAVPAAASAPKPPAPAVKSAASVPANSPGPHVKPVLKSAPSGRRDAAVSVFSSSEIGSLEMGADLASSSLREAAICFAEGDSTGAQEVLLTAIKAENAESELVHGYCVALLDLYRATGQRAAFEAAAIDFAERFGKSAPEWFSAVELPGRNGAGAGAPAPDTAARPVIARQIVWECPATLDLLAMKALRASLALNDLPKHLNWSGLKTIDADAAKELAELFAQWCTKKVELHFAAVQVLSAVLKGYTPSSDMRVDTMWWQLRLDALRILGMRDDFENVALDFCVLYEISPPSWKDPVCVCVHELAVDEAPSSALDSSYDTSSVGLDINDAAVLELSGEILGDSVPALDQLQKDCEGAEAVVISCARLTRVDFVAAGNILNWVAQRQASGVHVQFSDVPPLVGAFFSVIGIDEHAAVVLRLR